MSGLSSVGLAGLFEEEEAFRLKERKRHNETWHLKRKAASLLRGDVCPVCGDYFETRSNTQKTCGSEWCMEENRTMVERAYRQHRLEEKRRLREEVKNG